MKATLDTISLCLMIIREGLRENSQEKTYEFVNEWFEQNRFENEFIQDSFRRLVMEIIDLKIARDYLQ